METFLQQLTRGNALLLIIILGAGGSFQVGYHLTVLSSPSPYIQRFINSSWYYRYKEPLPAQTVTMIWSLIVSLYAVGGLCGAVSVKFISGWLGRKKAVIFNCFIAIVASGIMLTSKMANSFEMIIVARILYGYSSGGKVPLTVGHWMISLEDRMLGHPLNFCDRAALFTDLSSLTGKLSVQEASFESTQKEEQKLFEGIVSKRTGRVIQKKSVTINLIDFEWNFIGLGSSLHVMYLGEISPRKIRGIVTLTSATFSSLGKLSGQFFGLSEILGREELWNIVLCVSAFFSLVTIMALPFLPEAPRYVLIEKGDDEACKKALQTLWGPGDYKEEMDEMLTEQASIEAAPPKSLLQLLSDRTIRWQLISMSLIYSCNQLSGMSAINTFSFDIFTEVGIPANKIRYVTVGLGVCEIITSISCGLIIERTGRRPLLWGGYGLMSACWVFVTVTMNLKNSYHWVPYITAGFIFIFIIFFCGGPGGVTATLNSEVFIQSNRVAALVFMGIQRWFTFAVMGLVFPFIIEALSSYCFVLFACMCLLGCLYTFFILPETKGKTLLEISEEFKAITVCGKSFAGKKSVETRL